MVCNMHLMLSSRQLQYQVVAQGNQWKEVSGTASIQTHDNECPQILSPVCCYCASLISPPIPPPTPHYDMG